MSSNNPAFASHFSHPSEQRYQSHKQSLLNPEVNSIRPNPAYRQSQNTSPFAYGSTNLYQDRRLPQDQYIWQPPINDKPAESTDLWYNRQAPNTTSSSAAVPNVYSGQRGDDSESLQNGRLYDTSALGSLAYVSTMDMSAANKSRSAVNGHQTSRQPNMGLQVTRQDPVSSYSTGDAGFQQNRTRPTGLGYGYAQERPNSSNSNNSVPARTPSAASRNASSAVVPNGSYVGAGTSQAHSHGNHAGGFGSNAGYSQGMAGSNYNEGATAAMQSRQPQYASYPQHDGPSSFDGNAHPNQSAQPSRFSNHTMASPPVTQSQPAQAAFQNSNYATTGPQPPPGFPPQGARTDSGFQPLHSRPWQNDATATQGQAEAQKIQDSVQKRPDSQHQRRTSRKETQVQPIRHDNHTTQSSQGNPSTVKAPTTINPSQIYNPPAQQPYALGPSRPTASYDGPSDSHGERLPVDTGLAVSSLANNPAGPDPASMVSAMAVATQSDEQLPSTGPHANMESQMRDMVEKMREYQAKDPNLFSQIWDQLKKGSSQGRTSPQTARSPPASNKSAPVKQVSPKTKNSTSSRKPRGQTAKSSSSSRQNAEKQSAFDNMVKPGNAAAANDSLGSNPNANRNMASNVNLTAGTDGAHPTGDPAGNISGPFSEPPSQVGTGQAKSMPSNPQTHVEAVAVAPSAGPTRPAQKGTSWPESKIAGLAAAAVKALTIYPENYDKQMSAEYVCALLKKNPSYIELCEHFEQLGFRLDRSRFAKSLLQAVPDQAQAPTQSSTSSSQSGLNASLARSPQLTAASRASLETAANGVLDNAQSTRKSGPPTRGPGRPRKDGTPTQPRAQGNMLSSDVNNSDLASNIAPTGTSHVTSTNAATSVQPVNTLLAGGHGSGSATDLNSRLSSQLVIDPALTSLNQQPRTPLMEDEVRANYAKYKRPSFKAFAGTSLPGASVDGQSAPPHNDSTLTDDQVRALAMAAGLGDSLSVSAPTSSRKVTHVPPPPPRPKTKEEAARRRTIAEIVDLTEEVDDLPERPPKRRFFGSMVEDLGNATPFDISTPADVSAITEDELPTTGAANRDGTIVEKRKNLSSAGLARPLEKKEALRKSQYDPRTIARDVLIASGRHPTTRGLNSHLEALRVSFPTVLNQADLETFKWDLVDPPPSPRTKAAEPQMSVNSPNEEVPSKVNVSTMNNKRAKPAPGSGRKHESPRGQATPGLRGSVRITPRKGGFPGPKATKGRPTGSEGNITPVPGAKSGTSTPKWDKTKPAIGVPRSLLNEPDPRRMLPEFPTSGGRRPVVSTLKMNFAIPVYGEPSASSSSTPRSNASKTTAAGPNTPSKPFSILIDSQSPSAAVSATKLRTTEHAPKPAKPSQTPASEGAIGVDESTDESDPGFKVFRCRWKDCSAELHNQDTLEKHFFKVHRPQTTAKGFPCLWLGCEDSRKTSATRASPRDAGNNATGFDTEASWIQHIRDCHFAQNTPKTGDGTPKT
ncbi:MAG: hypothetical protein M4579_001133 [Chaenotheca gracillima]|nr:MAG: hypothetical protein M4579_001133 [Chaenotheca gracillima]